MADLAAILDQVALACPSAVAALDLDFAFQLQLSEAIKASLGVLDPYAPSTSNAAAASSSSSASSTQPAHLARAEQHRRDAQALAAASVRVAAHDALFARDLAAIPDDRWDHDGNDFERPLDVDAPLFRLSFKGMSSKCQTPEVVGPTVAALAVAVCDPLGEVVIRIQKPVEGFVPALGGRMELEVMALTEGLDAALRRGIRSINVVTDYRPLHNNLLGIWPPNRKKRADMINEVLSVLGKFEQCEISLVPPSQLGYVIKLATDSIDSQLAKTIAVNATKYKRETCTICLEDADVSKMHGVEDCGHRFCFSCMKEHVKVKLLDGMLPACPQDGCTTKLTVKGSKIFLSPRLTEIMVQRIREAQIPLTEKIYCPYSKCSALMSLSEVAHPVQASSSKQTVGAATLRKCVKCRGSFCISCKIPWHDRMTCYDYKRRYPHPRPEDAKLQNLAQQRLWRQCVKCKHMIELAEGCYHMTCVCGYEFCYTCGKEWKDKKATCSCPLWDERNIIHDDIEEDYVEEDDDYYSSDDEDYNADYYRFHGDGVVVNI